MSGRCRLFPQDAWLVGAAHHDTRRLRIGLHFNLIWDDVGLDTFPAELGSVLNQSQDLRRDVRSIFLSFIIDRRTTTNFR